MAVRKTPTTTNFGPTITGTAYADAVNVEVSDLWDRTAQWLDNVVGTNTVTATTNPTLGAYAKNQQWNWIPQNTNTGPVQINIDGKGLRNVVAANGSALVGGECVGGVAQRLVDTGTNLRMMATVIASVNVLTSIFAYTQPNNTAGGNATSGARRTYPLNTTILNEIPGASLNAAGVDINKVVLPAGTYEIDASAALYNASENRLFLFNDTAAADIATVVSNQGRSANGNIALPSLVGKFSLTVTSTITFQYQVQSTTNTDGLGRAANFGATQQFGFIRFKKVA